MKRYFILLLFLFIVNNSNAGVYETNGHSSELYENDISILKKKLSLNAKDKNALERIVKMLFVCEKFEESARYADEYLKNYNDPGIEYLKSLSLASYGNYSGAIDSARKILSEKSISPAERKSIETKIELFEKGISTKGIPYGAEMTKWGKDAYAAGIIGRSGILVGVRTFSDKTFLYSVGEDKIIESMKEPQFEFPAGMKLLSVSVSPDGRDIFTTCGKSEKSIVVYHRRFDIETEKWSDWSQPQFANEGSINGFANMLGDGEHVLFVSNRNASNGLDVFVASRNEKGIWDNPVSLSDINTAMDECSVYLHPDGETVYFATNGRGGSGGYDVYSGSLSSLKGKFKIENIENLKQLNTFRNEFFPLYVHATSGRAFHSFRKNDSSVICNLSDNIAGGALVMFLDIVTLDSVTKSPVRATVKLVRIGDRTSGIALKSAADIRGRSPFTVRKRTLYSAEITAEGYAYYNETFETSGENDTLTKTVYLDKGKVKTGYTFTADNIYFDSGSSAIRPESIPALERLNDFLKNNPGVKIEISGHTDNVGSQDFNMKLSKKRAEAVAEYLFGRGVKNNRISTRGFGFSNSAASNDNDVNRQKNRRVEITVKSSD